MPLVDTADLCDANDVAQILGLSRATAVSVYQSRYPDFPRPVWDKGSNKTKLWLRPEVVAWAETRSAKRRGDDKPMGKG